MNFIKAKYLKGSVPSGRSYTFKTEDTVTSGDIVLSGDSKLLVIDEPVDRKWLETYGERNVKEVKKMKAEELR